MRQLRLAGFVGVFAFYSLSKGKGSGSSPLVGARMERGCPFGGYYGSIGQQGWCGRGGAAGCGEICLGRRRDRPWCLEVGGEGRAEPRAGALAAGWAVVPWSRAIGRDRGFLLPPALPLGEGAESGFLALSLSASGIVIRLDSKMSWEVFLLFHFLGRFVQLVLILKCLVEFTTETIWA